MTTNNPIPVPVSAAAGHVEVVNDHGQLVVRVRDLAHIRAGVQIAETLAKRAAR
jgi:hypothetical protein